jgi:VWFA-related protein
MSPQALLGVGVALALYAPLLPAEEGAPQVSTARARTRERVSRASIRVDSRLVLVPVTVTNPLGAPFTGLPAEAFRLFEDGIEQEIRSCSSTDAPVSLGVVFDASQSMGKKLRQSRAAVSQFLATAIPGDEFFLVEFSNAPRLLVDFTTDSAHLEQSLKGIKAQQWTALLDAVYIAMHNMKRARNPRKALLVLSDGGDNRSRYSEAEMRALVREGDVVIYSIALTGGGILGRHVRMLRRLSEETGGMVCEVEELDELPDAVEKISAAIRQQYLLGFVPANARNDGLYRRLRVVLNQPAGQPPLRASWRAGYYAPVGP